jgi:zinc and cadmium transporter
MGMALVYIVIFSLLAGIGSVSLASVVLVMPQRWHDILIPCLLSYAIGTLLGAAFLGLLPQSVSAIGLAATSQSLLAGIVVFFILEKLLIWRHCHKEHCEPHSTSGPLILVGDALHNLIDGVVIATAFATSTSLGFATAIAIIGHEIPQELGDFAVLLECGYSKGQAYFYNVLSSSTTLLAGVGTYFFLAHISSVLPYITSLAAASFVYIAIADLVPTLHRRTGLRSMLLQTFLILAGIGTIMTVSHDHH